MTTGWASRFEVERPSVRVLNDDQIFKLLADPTRRRILALLCQDSFSAAEIAERLKKSPQTIRYHFSQLEKAKLIRVCEKKRCQNAYHVREQVYEATAGMFHFCFGETPNTRPVLSKGFNKLTELLRKIGLPLSSVEESLFREMFSEVNENLTNIIKKIEKVMTEKNGTPWIDGLHLANILVEHILRVKEASVDK